MNVYFILWRSRLLFKFNKNIKEFSQNFSTVWSVILELENPSFIFAIRCITLMQQISIGLIQFPNTFFPTIFRDCNNLQMLNFLLYQCNTTFHLLWYLGIMITSACQTQRTTRINPTSYVAVKIAVEACKIGSTCAKFCFR
jgi:hypothetical protein